MKKKGSGLVPFKDEAEKLVDVPGDGIETLSTLEIRHEIQRLTKNSGRVDDLVYELCRRIEKEAGFTPIKPKMTYKEVAKEGCPQFTEEDRKRRPTEKERREKPRWKEWIWKGGTLNRKLYYGRTKSGTFWAFLSWPERKEWISKGKGRTKLGSTNRALQEAAKRNEVYRY